jgi:spermidine synthase
LSGIIALAALSLLVVTWFKFSVLVAMSASLLDLRFRSFLTALIIFGPTSTLLGMVSPYAVRLKIDSIAASGRLVGNLYALSTLGSIVGTFTAGFFLIAYLGTTNILLLLAFILFVASLLIFWDKNRGPRIVGASLAVVSLLIPTLLQGYFIQNGIIADVDTAYNRFLLIESFDADTNRPTLNLVSSREATQAGMFIDTDDDLVYPYSKYYRLADFFNPNIQNALMIGGGAYSYPKDFLKKHPDATLDVVEIDPGVTALAEQYFNLKPDPRLHIYHEDGRVFLNRHQEKKYDAVYGDAFHSYFDVPFQLTTVEAGQKIADKLTDQGVYIVNINATLGNEGSRLLEAETATLQKVFPQVYQLPVATDTDQNKLQNIMLVALKTTVVPNWKSAAGETIKQLAHRQQKNFDAGTIVLTDDYAPVEQYILSLVKK